ncbi:mediator of RNA polymerase II transcription subunit 21-like [Ananas comosus]|uniref:Mediator of RNA polymerase II transcription subunit 21 n=1 Tax=Ananas comosus TaxID=4615 RepID=A0A6P5FFC2_ANACO|nr:mediator of RNA polymerase II transcription subunit 21-like [Ananas comosus]
MDIISQLQEQVNTIAMLALNTFGTLRRDAPPVRLSPDYPEPPATNPSEETVNVAEQSKAMSAALVQAAKKFDMLVVALPLSGENAQLKRIVNVEKKTKSFK